jgi:hypothetical protein
VKTDSQRRSRHVQGNHTEHRYKFHNILITCRPTDPPGFVAEICIRNSELITVKNFKFAQKFNTETEAHKYALVVARDWINDHRRMLPAAII